LHRAAAGFRCDFRSRAFAPLVGGGAPLHTTLDTLRNAGDDTTDDSAGDARWNILRRHLGLLLGVLLEGVGSRGSVLL
jgi:hypothetical protein